MHDGEPRFEAELFPQLKAIPFFRDATLIEIEASYQVGVTKRWDRLCEVWAEVAQPTRAELPGLLGRAYARAGASPRGASAYSFLASVRAVLAAGKRFRAGLSPSVRRALETEFPWLERRHEHLPDGWTPALDFPPVFAAFIDVPDLEEAKARWQLCASINEVQQAAYSAYAARLFRLPELEAHAARERQLAINYFSHWAPACTLPLWRQCILMLDGLNAAVFAMMCRDRAGEMVARSLGGAIFHRGEWRAFVKGLEAPQWTLDVTPPR